MTNKIENKIILYENVSNIKHLFKNIHTPKSS